MKRVSLRDDAGGNALGWNPDGVATTFTILASEVSGFDTGFVSIMPLTASARQCVVDTFGKGLFRVGCSVAPSNGSQLHYLVTNLPAHVDE
jgi:hypothetical protein